MPYAGSFHLYAKKFIGPGTAFTVAVLYWLNWIMALASEFTAAGIIMRHWFPRSPTALWSALFIGLVLGLNILSVRIYGEAEFWFASVKVVTIVIFILVGLAAIVGVLPLHAGGVGAGGAGGSTGVGHATGLINFTKDGLFLTGIAPVFSTLLTVIFAFSGTEVVGVAAGETKDPGKAIPRAIHSTVFRLTVFFIGSIAVMAALIPWKRVGVGTSPFVLVFESIGLPFAGDVMNFVVLTVLISAANSGLYVCSRMVWSLAREGTLPRWPRPTSTECRSGAVLISIAGSLLALLSSVYAASTVYLALVSISGLATILVWISIAVCQILFRRRLIASGKDPSDSSALAYRTAGYPFTPLLAILMCLGALVLVALDPSQRPALLAMIPFIAACYAIYYRKEILLFLRRRLRR